MASSSLVVHVCDTGVGISFEELGDLFDDSPINPEFSEGKDKISGLLIVKTIVEKIGGTISVDSEGPGSGSVFAFCLPMRADTGSLESV